MARSKAPARFDLNKVETWVPCIGCATAQQLTQILEWLFTMDFKHGKKHALLHDAIRLLCEVTDPNSIVQNGVTTIMGMAAYCIEDALFREEIVSYFLENGGFISTVEFNNANRKIPPLLPLDAVVDRMYFYSNYVIAWQAGYHVPPIVRTQSEFLRIERELRRRNLDPNTCTRHLTFEF